MGLFDMRMKPREYEKWRRTRAKGKRRFVLINGALVFALTATVLSLVGLQFVDPPVRPFSAKFLVALVVLCVVTPVFGGLYVGPTIWKMNEERYARTEAPGPDKESP